MGRAEVRGNQQQQACSSGRQEDKTGQDAGCSGRQALGRMKCGMGVLSLVLNQIRPAAGREWSRQAGKQASKQRSVPLVVRCSAQHQEGPSRSCSASISASSSASACGGATTQEPRRSPSTDHGTASLAYIHNSPHYSCPSRCLRIAHVHTLHSLHPQVQYH